MKKTLLFCSFLLILTLIVGCERKETKKETEPAPRLVKAMTLQENQQQFSRSYPARVSASQKVNLSFQVAGRLIQLPVWEGEEVKQGQLLAALDPKDYEIKLNQQQAKYDFANITHERYKKLLPTDAISVAQYDEKKSIYDLEKANLEEAKKALADTKIFAPFDGVVSNRYVENYQYVQAKEKIISLQDISDIELILFIPEQDITNADEIKQLENQSGRNIVGVAKFSAIPDKNFPVYVKQVQTEADVNTQSYKVTLIMKRPEQKIVLPGMTAKVYMQFKQQENPLRIPFSAVAIDSKGDSFVWVIDPNTKQVKKQFIKVSDLKGEMVTVNSGLKYGETIVTAGVDYLQPNMKVIIQTGRIGH